MTAPEETVVQSGRLYTPEHAPFKIRTEIQPGDVGTIAGRHGIQYHNEFSWSLTFESLVARICADYVDNFDPSCERLWIAEHPTTNDFLGCIMLVQDTSVKHVAKLRLLLVEPKARGTGLGQTLIRLCIEYARSVGYQQVGLWTQSCLVGARRLYRKAGFRLMREEAHTSFGVDLVGEFWSLHLNDDTT